jgi:hypothetical protein
MGIDRTVPLIIGLKKWAVGEGRITEHGRSCCCADGFPPLSVALDRHRSQRRLP